MANSSSRLILGGTSLRNHVKLRVVLSDGVDGFGEVGLHVHRQDGRRRRASAAPGASCRQRGQHLLGLRQQRGEELIEQARVPDGLDARDLASFVGREDVASPILLRRIGGRHEKDFVQGVAAGNQHQGAAFLGDAGEIEEIVLLAIGPIDVTGVVARLGSPEDENAFVADLFGDGFAARGEVGHPVALPRGGRRRGDFPDAGIGRKCGHGEQG